jgi:ABC-2 type transport system ATP-binding protein
MRSDSARRLIAVLAALAAALVGAVVPTAQAAEQIVETALLTPGTPEPDGEPVMIDTTILTADPATTRPAIVLAHGFGGTKDDSLSTARTLASDGYTVIIYTARGFGKSGGLIHLDNPAYEGADARKIIDLAATRPEVIKDGDDPVIGFAGASYGGAISLLAAALDPRVDAIVPAFTWNSLSQSLFPQHQVGAGQQAPADVTPRGQPGVFKQRWASLLFRGAGQPPQGANTNPVCGRFAPEFCTGYLRAAERGRPDPALIKLLDESGPRQYLEKITAPTMIIAGEDDTLFPLDQADANLRGLPSSTPARLSWVAGGHDGDVSTDDLTGELQAWFGRYLKRDGSATDTRFSLVMPERSLVGEGGGRDPQTLLAPTYPGPDTGLTQRRVDLSGDEQTVVAPPGGTPAALTNLPGTGGALAQASGIAGYTLGVLPGQAATFTSAPLQEPLDLIGSGRIALAVTSDRSTATLFASAWDLGPELERTVGGRTTNGPSTAVLPQLAVAPVRLSGLTPGRPVEITVALPAVAHQVPVGHRLQVVVSSTDQAYAVPVRPAIYRIGLVAGSVLTVPEFATTPLNAGTLDVPLPLIIVVGALIIAAVLAVIIFGHRQRRAQLRPDLAGVPLVVTDVVKTYGDGFRAVDGVSFRAEAGQVVGLLGPNGAGKTTAIRMLVGLIRPDSGEIFVDGEAVHDGADVLRSVGAFIEGPGFLPHLTGMQNLNAYWQATGRPTEEAHFDEALEIAGLGTAIDRRVRGYSHGMRQRLGIAQAMLGLPPLLLLDEPTNGLDPPQIKAMRSVLADYAATGRTVVVSSHLLAEVQQTCSHVVVMHLGKVILTGSMAELTATEDVTLVGLADAGDRALAEQVLTGLGLDTASDGELIKVTGAVARPRLVAELVDAGVRVDSLDGHRQLEEVFMNLVDPQSTPQAAEGERR